MFGVRRSGWVAVLGAAAVLCPSGVAAAAGPSLRSYLLRSGEQPGYTVVKGSVRVQHSAAGFADPVPGSAKQLRKAGFVAAAGEELRASHHRLGSSLVVRFTKQRSAVELAKGEVKWVTELVRAAPGVKVRQFSLPGVARSYGVSFRSGKGGAALLFWVEGDCMFFSSQDLSHVARLTARRLASAVITGAESQRARTNGRCPAVSASFAG